ncbi:MAG TPA: hypothetical protein VER04_06665 [Polyangiaceae bacterium]|nr:hypothetical protein [Polyangiaceae bacterium]
MLLLLVITPLKVTSAVVVPHEDDPNASSTALTGSSPPFAELGAKRAVAFFLRAKFLSAHSSETAVPRAATIAFCQAGGVVAASASMHERLRQ